MVFLSSSSHFPLFTTNISMLLLAYFLTLKTNNAAVPCDICKYDSEKLRAVLNQKDRRGPVCHKVT